MQSPIPHTPIPQMALKLEPQNKKLKHITIMRNAILGRSNEPEVIFIDDFEISRQHAKLYQEMINYKLAWLIQDLNSVNGTYVNGSQIIRPTILNNKDKIHLGQTTFTVMIDETFIWQGQGEYAPNLERPLPISTPLVTQPHHQLNPKKRQKLLNWELLGLLGILGVGWWRAGQTSIAILWFVVGLFLVIFSTLLALTLNNSLFWVGGWFLLLLSTGFSLWQLVYQNK